MRAPPSGGNSGLQRHQLHSAEVERSDLSRPVDTDLAQAAWDLARSAADQDLPVQVTDEATLENVARLIAQPGAHLSIGATG